MFWSKKINSKRWGHKIVVCGMALLLLASVAGCGSKVGSNTETNAGSNAGISAVATTLGKLLDSEMAKYYVDTAWLKQNLDKVVILDARKDAEYQGGHIPGAINVTWQSLSNMQPKQGQPGWGWSYLWINWQRNLAAWE